MTAPSYVLDTNVALLLARGGTLGRTIADRYELKGFGVRPILSIVSHGELRSLARRRSWGDNKLDALDRIIASCVTVEISQEVIDAYVDLDAASHAAGRTMGKNDLWIAATALAARVPLLTTDKDFAHLGPDWIGLEYCDPAGLG